MKLLNTFMVGATIALTSPSIVEANAIKGQKLFIKQYKESCGMSGAVMAGKHTQDEWEALNDAGKLEEEMKTLCPNIKDVKESYLPHMYDFFYKYASDSGNVPSC
jgi:hypothetical protein